MSKKRPNAPINLADFKAKKEEEGLIPVETGNGTFNLRTASMLSDGELAHLKDLGDDVVGAAKLMVVGDYDAFVEAGGSAMLVSAILKEHGGEDETESGNA